MKNLKRIREEKGVTQLEVAEAIGTAQGNYSRIEAGKHIVLLTTAKKIADFLGVTIDELVK